MTVRLSLTPELETRLREQAAAAGKDIESFVLDAVQEKIGASAVSSGQRNPAANERRVAEWLSWTGSHPKLGYTVDDSRESIYAGRGE